MYVCKLGYVGRSWEILMVFIFPAGYVGGSGWSENRANTCPNIQRDEPITAGDGKPS